MSPPGDRGAKVSVGRREFLAGLGGAAAGFGFGAVSHILPLSSPEVGPGWRPGIESSVTSTCLLCPAHCGIRGRLVDGALVRIDGNPLHPISRGGLCPKGRAGIQLLYHPARLTGPVERVGAPGSDDFRSLSWDDALQRVAGALTAGGRPSPAPPMWITGRVPGVMRELIRRFAGASGSQPPLEEDRADGAARVMELCQGIASPPAFQLENADLVLSFGAPLSEAWWSPPLASLARAGADGARPRWIQVDVRHSRTAAAADEWVAVRPGTYGSLALGLAYVILKEGLYDAARLHGAIADLEDRQDRDGRVVPGFRSFVMRYGRTERIAERTGVPGEAIVRLAKRFGAASRPLAIWDQAVAWRSGGLGDGLAVHALNVLSGALNRPGGVLVQPELPFPALPGEAPGMEEAVDDGPGGRPAVGAAEWADDVLSGARPAAGILFLYYSDPVGSSAEPRTVARALERVPLVVSFSPFLDESARHADLVLPDHTYLERWGDAPAPAVVPTPVWGVVRPVVKPLHDTRATGDVLLYLAATLGSQYTAALPWTSVEQAVRQRGEALASAHRGSAFVPRFRQDELRELEARGWWLPHGLSKRGFWNWVSETGGWFDPFYDHHDRRTLSGFPDGKVQLLPAARELRVAAAGADGGEDYGAAAGDDHGEYPLWLVPYHVMTLASGGTALMPWLLERLGVMTDDAWECWAEIHPETGRELGLASGTAVRIESSRGAFRARLRFFEGAQPGVVNVPYGLHTRVTGWGPIAVANPLHAIGRRRDPETGLPDWYSTRVRIVPV